MQGWWRVTLAVHGSSSGTVLGGQVSAKAIRETALPPPPVPFGVLAVGCHSSEESSGSLAALGTNGASWESAAGCISYF